MIHLMNFSLSFLEVQKKALKHGYSFGENGWESLFFFFWGTLFWEFRGLSSYNWTSRSIPFLSGFDFEEVGDKLRAFELFDKIWLSRSKVSGTMALIWPFLFVIPSASIRQICTFSEADLFWPGQMTAERDIWHLMIFSLSHHDAWPKDAKGM